MRRPPVAPTLPTDPPEPAAPDATDRLQLRTMALSRWENEGGAAVEGPSRETDSDDEPSDDAAWTLAERVQLRVRVIALENLLIALLVDAPERQVALAREMAAYISPRPGFTPLPLTLRAAEEMRSLVDRSGRFRSRPAA
jgi:hypothetical protein